MIRTMHLTRMFGMLGLLALTTAATAATESFEVKVTSVMEGDLLTVERESESQIVRLRAVDCPERGQPYASSARDFAARLVQGRKVNIEAYGKDDQGHLIADVILASGRTLNETLVKFGWAWHDDRKGEDVGLAALQKEAQDTRRGLWSDPNAVAPWSFRARQNAGVNRDGKGSGLPKSTSPRSEKDSIPVIKLRGNLRYQPPPPAPRIETTRRSSQSSTGSRPQTAGMSPGGPYGSPPPVAPIRPEMMYPPYPTHMGGWSKDSGWYGPTPPLYTPRSVGRSVTTTPNYLWRWNEEKGAADLVGVW